MKAEQAGSGKAERMGNANSNLSKPLNVKTKCS